MKGENWKEDDGSKPVNYTENKGLHLESQTEQQQEEKWKFCLGKVCYSCGKDISKKARLNGSYVTSCPFCCHSFVG